MTLQVGVGLGFTENVTTARKLHMRVKRRAERSLMDAVEAEQLGLTELADTLLAAALLEEAAGKSGAKSSQRGTRKPLERVAPLVGRSPSASAEVKVGADHVPTEGNTNVRSAASERNERPPSRQTNGYVPIPDSLLQARWKEPMKVKLLRPAAADFEVMDIAAGCGSMLGQLLELSKLAEVALHELVRYEVRNGAKISRAQLMADLWGDAPISRRWRLSATSASAMYEALRKHRSPVAMYDQPQVFCDDFTSSGDGKRFRVSSRTMLASKRTGEGSGSVQIFQPMLFVGLGGAGCRVGAELEQLLREETKELSGVIARQAVSYPVSGHCMPQSIPSYLQVVYDDLGLIDGANRSWSNVNQLFGVSGMPGEIAVSSAGVHPSLASPPGPNVEGTLTSCANVVCGLPGKSPSWITLSLFHRGPDVLAGKGCGGLRQQAVCRRISTHRRTSSVHDRHFETAKRFRQLQDRKGLLPTGLGKSLVMPIAVTWLYPLWVIGFNAELAGRPGDGFGRTNVLHGRRRWTGQPNQLCGRRLMDSDGTGLRNRRAVALCMLSSNQADNDRTSGSTRSHRPSKVALRDESASSRLNLERRRGQAKIKNRAMIDRRRPVAAGHRGASRLLDTTQH